MESGLRTKILWRGKEKKKQTKKTAACETLDDFLAAALKVQQDNSALQCFPTL